MVIKGIVLAVYCSLAALLGHLAISRLRPGRRQGEPLIYELTRQLKLLAAAWGIAFLVYSLLYLLPSRRLGGLIAALKSALPGLSFAYGALLYLFLCFLYLTVYYFINRSVSATLMEIIEHSPRREMSAQELKAAYDVEKKYHKELKGMLEGGFIVEESGYYRATLKGRLFAVIARSAKRHLKLGPGG